jgi:chromosome segregation ATPase
MATEAQAPATPDSTDKANAKLNKVELMKKFKQHRDSVNKAILGLQRDSLTLSKDLQICSTQVAQLKVDVKHLQGVNDSLNGEVARLQTELQEAVKQQSAVAALASPSGCAVLIVLIIAITAIALKKGISIAKGDTTVSVGGDKKEQ